MLKTVYLLDVFSFSLRFTCGHVNIYFLLPSLPPSLPSSLLLFPFLSFIAPSILTDISLSVLTVARDSPWPKFDKAVSELHVWLDDVTDMMKTETIVLSDSEEIFALAEKQKVR